MSTLTTYTSNNKTPLRAGLRAGLAVMFLAVFMTACGGEKTGHSFGGKKGGLAKLEAVW